MAVVAQRWDDVAPDDLDPDDVDPDDVDVDPLPWNGTAGRWRRRVMTAFVLTVTIVAGWVLVDEFALLWWSRRAADLAASAPDDGRNVGAGLGAACTLVSLTLLVVALRRHTPWRLRAHLVAGAIVASAPTALTAAVGYGAGSGATTGRILLESDAPAFIEGTISGAGGATVVMLSFAVGVPAWRIYWARQQARKDAEAAAEAAAAAELAEGNDRRHPRRRRR